MSVNLKQFANGDPKWRSKKSPTKGILVNPNDKSQSAALAILQREEKDAKKNRVKMLLQQQFVQKYGSKHPNAPLNNVICVTISDFIDSCDSIREAENSVGALEAELREITVSYKQKHVASKQEERSSSNKSELANSQSSDSLSAPNSRPQSQSINVDPKQWTVVNAVIAVTQEQRAKAEQDTLIAKKHRFKDSLDTQIAQVQARKAATTNTDGDFVKNMYSDVDRYKKEEEDKVSNRYARNRAEMELRKKQIEDNARRLKDEEDMMMAYGKLEIARAQKGIEDEKNRMQRMKDDKKAAQDQVTRENQRNLELKEVQKQKDREYEAKLQKDMEERLIKEERARANYFNDKMAKMMKGNANFEASTGAELAKQAAVKEELLRQTIANKEAQDIEKERIKQETRRKNMEEGKRFNETLIARKHKERQDELEDSNRRAEELAKKVASMNATEELKEKIRHEKMVALKKDLDMQVQWKKEKAVTSDYNLSDKEIMLNKSIIQKLQSDPELQAKVVEKLQPPAAPQTNNLKYKKTSLSG